MTASERRRSTAQAATEPTFVSRARATSMAEVLRAVAHPLRLQIVALLCNGDANVNAMAERLHAPQPILSQQLRILRMAGLVSAARERGFVRYRLEQPHLRTLIRCINRCCEE